MSIKQLVTLAAGLAALSATSVASAKEITVMYAVNPPLMCEKNGQIDCVAGNLLKAAAKSSGFTLKAQQLPWARALETLNQTPNAIFAAQPVPDGAKPPGAQLLPVWTDDVFIWTLDGRKLSSDADIAKLQSVAVRRGTPFAVYMERKKSSAKIVDTNDWVQAAQMLDAGRVEAMTLTGQVGQANIVEAQKVPAARVNKYKVGELTFWLMSADQPSPEVAEFKKAVEAEKAKPEFQAELKRMGVRP